VVLTDFFMVYLLTPGFHTGLLFRSLVYLRPGKPGKMSRKSQKFVTVGIKSIDLLSLSFDILIGSPQLSDNSCYVIS
jgi:hypothetical protein